MRVAPVTGYGPAAVLGEPLALLGALLELLHELRDDLVDLLDVLLDGLREFTKELRGDFWGGDSLGLVDCTLLPYAYRLYVFEHYRGFKVPTEGEDGLWEKYQAWLARATSLASVKGTLPDKAKYLKHVAKYAEGKARSKVGNAVRRGASAHDYDDAIDGDEGETKAK